MSRREHAGSLSSTTRHNLSRAMLHRMVTPLRQGVLLFVYRLGGCRQHSSSTSNVAPPRLSSLSTSQDMEQAREWIGKFSQLSHDNWPKREPILYSLSLSLPSRRVNRSTFAFLRCSRLVRNFFRSVKRSRRSTCQPYIVESDSPIPSPFLFFPSSVSPPSSLPLSAFLSISSFPPHIEFDKSIPSPESG